MYPTSVYLRYSYYNPTMCNKKNMWGVTPGCGELGYRIEAGMLGCNHRGNYSETACKHCKLHN